MYEGKLRRLVDDQVRPLRERVERLESDLRKQRNTVPELRFGMFDLSSSGPLPSGRPYTVLGNLIDESRSREQIERARKQAKIKKAKQPWSSTLGIWLPGRRHRSRAPWVLLRLFAARYARATRKKVSLRPRSV